MNWQRIYLSFALLGIIASIIALVGIGIAWHLGNQSAQDDFETGFLFAQFVFWGARWGGDRHA